MILTRHHAISLEHNTTNNVVSSLQFVYLKEHCAKYEVNNITWPLHAAAIYSLFALEHFPLRGLFLDKSKSMCYWFDYW